MLIASRNGFAVKFPITAKNYVQSGLVAMWDGIENIGWKKHDSNTTTWKNLAGDDTYDITLTNKAKFVADAMEVAATGGRIAYGSTALPRNDNLYHYEIVVSYDGVFSGNLMVFTGGGMFTASGASRLCSPVVFYVSSQYKRKGFVFGSPATLYRLDTDYTWTGKHQASGTHDFMSYDGQPLSEVIFSDTFISMESNNTIMFSFANSNRTYDMPIGFRIHALRIYSSRLSESDRLSNYAVDKTRFNLP